MESNEQLIFEMIRWFDKYVKNAPARTVAEARRWSLSSRALHSATTSSRALLLQR